MKEFAELGKECFKPGCIAVAPIFLLSGCIMGAIKGGLFGALIGALLGCVTTPLGGLLVMIIASWVVWVVDRFE